MNRADVPPSKVGPSDRYAECGEQLAALLEGENDEIARMALTASVIMQFLPRVSFAGFYRVTEKDQLVIGPFQGPPACLRIPFSRGVCGACAERAESIVVPDTRRFPGHIACDPLARSELVVPVFGPSGAMIAVFDLDSHEPEAFDERDRTEIERIIQRVFGV